MLSTVILCIIRLSELFLPDWLSKHTFFSPHRLRGWLTSGLCCRPSCCWFWLWPNLWTAPRKMKSWSTQRWSSSRARPVIGETLHAVTEILLFSFPSWKCLCWAWRHQLNSICCILHSGYWECHRKSQRNHTEPNTYHMWVFRLFAAFFLPSVSPKKLCSFTLAAPSTTTFLSSSSPAPLCQGSQVMLENSTGCGCPPGMVRDGDNCTCPVGFSVEGAAGCQGEQGENELLLCILIYLQAVVVGVFFAGIQKNSWTKHNIHSFSYWEMVQ